MANNTSLIKVDSTSENHIKDTISTNDGVHGIRLHEGIIQYYSVTDQEWKNFFDGNIAISQHEYNALVKYIDGYYVEQFKISKENDNAIVKKLDGYYEQSFVEQSLIESPYRPSQLCRRTAVTVEHVCDLYAGQSR